ncbi:MBOAT family O-acyltransferase [Pseudahrensia aquimaris]|uniref:MBOAT family O-acyltransferase n=1 Tax=Pseudahrensia aquimaris TaxID=744461 RepID=A0ABW3FCP0_9HYPH
MIDFILYGIFSFDFFRETTLSNQPWLELARTPFALNLGILGALLVPFLLQSQVRRGLIQLSIGCLVVMTGLIFTGGVLAACCAVFGFARWTSVWVRRRGAIGLPHSLSWVFVIGLYFPFYFITYKPFDGFMTWGELTLFWGLAFLVFKAIHYLHMVCKSRVDPFEQDAFTRFLLYMIHFPSFWFGPYQRFDQFDGEVDTCKQRINRANRIAGAKRIALGCAKLFFVFHVFNLLHFYKLDFYGPFADEFFANVDEVPIWRVWLMVAYFGLRIAVFISAISDGVIGMNRMMGIRVPENSNYPLLARDMQEFWQRWHVQAGVFLREEVFFPIGGMRHRVRAFIAVFAFSGFWHFPSVSAVVVFTALQLVMMELAVRWARFWKTHARKDDWVHAAGLRYRLHDTWLSGGVGIVLHWFVNMISVVLIHDHFFGGTTVFPRMFGF